MGIEYRRYGTNPSLETRAEANDSVDKKRRYKQIIEIMTLNKEPMTAKEISVEMFKRGYTPTSERNFSSPRITEMLKNGLVDVVGKKKCKYTGKTVTVYVLLDGQTTIFDYL